MPTAATDLGRKRSELFSSGTSATSDCQAGDFVRSLQSRVVEMSVKNQDRRCRSTDGPICFFDAVQSSIERRKMDQKFDIPCTTAGVKSFNPSTEGCHRQSAKATGSLSTSSKVHWMPLKLATFRLKTFDKEGHCKSRFEINQSSIMPNF
jgi:hypothetical protein